MRQFMTSIGRKVFVINLDPANDQLPYHCDVDVRDLINLEDVMDIQALGPNGGMLYCMEFLLENLAWLEVQLKKIVSGTDYVLFDCPGQVELYTHHTAVRGLCRRFQKLGYQLTCVHLVDSHFCSDAPKYLSALLVCLATMTFLELPHVNVLSKMDLIEKHGKLAFNLDYYAEVQDLRYLLQLFENQGPKRFSKLNDAIVEVVEDFSLVGFFALDISDKSSVHKLLKEIDKSNGYIYGLPDSLPPGTFAVQAQAQDLDDLLDIQERYMSVDGGEDDPQQALDEKTEVEESNKD
eukprot:c1827_g1_i1.p1 GENE.c1827_g1_i1~~c1827_g1_i1.p1  ORF type:complete len:324 (-),score=70.03 c1827_g1_i1:319-1197(-)